MLGNSQLCFNRQIILHVISCMTYFSPFDCSEMEIPYDSNYFQLFLNAA